MALLQPPLHLVEIGDIELVDVIFCSRLAFCNSLERILKANVGAHFLRVGRCLRFLVKIHVPRSKQRGRNPCCCRSLLSFMLISATGGSNSRSGVILHLFDEIENRSSWWSVLLRCLVPANKIRSKRWHIDSPGTGIFIAIEVGLHCVGRAHSDFIFRDISVQLRRYRQLNVGNCRNVNNS